MSPNTLWNPDLMFTTSSAAAEVANDSSSAWVAALAIAAAVALVGLVVLAARRDRAHRLEVFQTLAAQEGLVLTRGDSGDAVVASLERSGDRGRPASGRRRRGGGWDTPVVPTISPRPVRPDRHRGRRIG